MVESEMEIRDGSPTDRGGTGGGGGNGGGAAEKEATLAVKVALNIRPLIGLERVQGCKDCISVVPSEPQVQLGSHSFTFDHVYGSTGTPLARVFDECVSPLVDGLFQGFNATVLAYGQTGSGKTYTMGTGYTVGGSTEGVIPKVMDTIFAKIEGLKAKADFQIRVSFIEILKEEVHDLLDPSPPPTARADLTNGGAFGDSKYSNKPAVTGKPPIQIRETTNGGITLAGVTETDVNALGEMALCLEQGSLCRATGSTMMNTRSSRSHAIFTITLEQRRKWDTILNGTNPLLEDAGEDFLCAKFHLVDLAGSERAKRTGADGMRFKEGVHINKGLLALGNVISALGDDKKRKEGGHVPYRDSKLTRLLQDSLGGNSRTVMIACVSPADSNAEETLNTLKYANRARNIQNKPTINRDPMAAEMSRMRQQLELMQAELLCARAGSAPEEVQLLKQKIVWLETSNMDLRHELQEARTTIQEYVQQGLDARVQNDKLRLKLDRLRSGRTFAEIDAEDDAATEGLLKEQLKRIQDLEGELLKLQASGGRSRPQTALAALALGDVDGMAGYSGIPSTNASSLGTELPAESAAEDQAKEIEHNMMQENFDKELQELNKCLEQKEAEMKTFVRSEPLVLKQHFERKLVELEEEKNSLQRERDRLVTELETLATASDEQTQKMQETYVQKLKELESQIADLKKKQESQAQHLRAKQRADEAAKRLQDDILKIKTQKVHLQQKIKQESEQFRQWKASRERELLQLRKEGRRNVYEMHKLQALHQRQKLVLQRKTEEAAVATRRLKELLEARRSPRDSHGSTTSGQNNEKTLQHWLEQELEMTVRVHEVRSAYEKQMEERVVLAKELASLKDHRGDGESPDGEEQMPSMSPGARSARVRLLETMLNSSSSSLVAMASQLSEAEERERSAGGRARWQHMRSMGDAKILLQSAFDTSAVSRCRLRDFEEENSEMKEKLSELRQLLRESEACRTRLERQQRAGNASGMPSLPSMNTTGPDSGRRKSGDRKMKSGTGGITRHRASDNSSTGNDDKLPYGLRKAGRDHRASSKHHHTLLADEKSDSSEGELDMDTDSDEEWNEDSERQAVRKGSRALGGPRPKAGPPSSFDRKMTMSSGPSPHGSRSPPPNHHQQTPQLLLQQQAPQPPHSPKLSTTTTSAAIGIASGETAPDGEGNEDDDYEKGKERSYHHHHQACSCSCSQSSGCKTKKCECKAAGGLCGTRCGCNAGKCINREAVALEEEQRGEQQLLLPFSLARPPPLQMEALEPSLAPAGVDQNQRRRLASDPRGEAAAQQYVAGGESPVHIVTEEEHVTKRAERLMAAHGASLLETAWKDELRQDDAAAAAAAAAAAVAAGEKRREAPPGEDDVGVSRKAQRHPLQDIGNKVSSKGRPIGKQRRKHKTTVIQIVAMGPARSAGAATPAPAAAASAAPAAPPVAANVPAAAGVVLPTGVPPAAVPDAVILSPLWRQHHVQRRNSVGHLSPLRLRDNKVGASNSGIGSSDDAQGGSGGGGGVGPSKNAWAVGSAAAGAGPGSPSGRGDEKENIHRNSLV